MKTFQDFAAEHLQGFGWSIDAADIPDWDTAAGVIQGLHDWWRGMDDRTRQIITMSNADLSDGLWQMGMLTNWPALYGVLNGSPVGGTFDTLTDVVLVLNRAHHDVDEQPSDPVSDVNEVINAGNEDSEQNETEDVTQ